MPGCGDEQLSASIEEAAFTPAGRWNLLGHADFETAWPAPHDICLVYPGQRHDHFLDGRKIRTQKAVVKLVANRFLDLQRTDALERTFDRYRTDRLIE